VWCAARWAALDFDVASAGAANNRAHQDSRLVGAELDIAHNQAGRLRSVPIDTPRRECHPATPRSMGMAEHLARTQPFVHVDVAAEHAA
jgi:hypothetical protein